MAASDSTSRLPAVCIIVVNWNGRADTLACLESLSCVAYPNREVIVVDNGSVDGSATAIRAAYPATEVIEAGANLGYAAGNNLGLRYALARGCQFLLLLNNDTVVAPDFLDRLLAVCLADETIGVAGPKIYYFDRPQVIWSAGGQIDWRHGSSSMRGLNATDNGQFDQSAAVDFVTGCALLVRSDAVALAGLLDERFGMYFEETEWCVRIARLGWRILCVPESHIWHKIRPEAQDQSPRVRYYMPRNRLLFLRLTGASWRVWLDALVLQDLRHWCSWLRPGRYRQHRVQRLALLRAWRDFALGRFGMVK
jgi:GT2 family glycosyltransferase